MQPADYPLKTKFSYISVVKNQSKNAKPQSEHAKIISENPKTQFDNAKTQKTAQVLAQVFPDTLILNFKGQQLEGSTVKLLATIRVSISP